MLESVLITGANAGLGKESARQLAQIGSVKKIYLGCRNIEKARTAKQELETITGRQIFEILQIDVADIDSVKSAVATLKEPVDGLIMNAGGTGGQQFSKHTKEGVTQIVAVNLLGHVALTNELIKLNKLKKVAVYAGSEAARGVKEMGMKQPKFASSSVAEFMSLCKGELYGHQSDATIPYGPIKYLAALWMSSLAREHRQIRFVTMSPGGTTGTEGFNSLSPVKQFVMKSMMRLMLLLGKVHKVETGAKRYIDALLKDSYISGGFYGSKKGLTGPVGEQGVHFADLTNKTYQDNAKVALQNFLKA